MWCRSRRVLSALTDNSLLKIICYIPSDHSTQPHAIITKGAFHLSELTGQTIPVAMIISLLIKTLRPDLRRSVKSWIACAKEMVFSKDSWKKPISFSNWPVGQWFGPPVLTNGKRPKWYVACSWLSILQIAVLKGNPAFQEVIKQGASPTRKINMTSWSYTRV